MIHCGVIGLGQMGRGIARRLDAAGLLAAASDTAPGAFEAAELSGGVQGDCAVAEVLLFAVPETAQISAGT